MVKGDRRHTIYGIPGGFTMTKQEILRKIDDLTMESNYIAAYGYLREYLPEDSVRFEYGGKIAMAIIEEIDHLPPGKEGKQRLLYLRSILMWIFRDIPGLGGLYRDELKNAGERLDPIGDVVKNLQNLSKFISGGNASTEQVKDTFEVLRKNIDKTIEDLGGGDVQDQVKTFFSNVERGLRESVNIAADILSPDPEYKAGEAEPDEEAEPEIRDVTEEEGKEK
jgi:hypothetical protein